MTNQRWWGCMGVFRTSTGSKANDDGDGGGFHCVMHRRNTMLRMMILITRGVVVVVADATEEEEESRWLFLLFGWWWQWWLSWGIMDSHITDSFHNNHRYISMNDEHTPWFDCCWLLCSIRSFGVGRPPHIRHCRLSTLSQDLNLTLSRECVHRRTISYDRWKRAPCTLPGILALVESIYWL